VLVAAGLTLAAGTWIDSVPAALTAARELGWPIKVWGMQDDRVSCSRTFQTAEALRAYTRRELREHEQLWLQRTGYHGLDIRIRAVRDGKLGPIITIETDGVYSGRAESRLLPTSRENAAFWLSSGSLTRLVSPLDADGRALPALAEAIEALSRLLLELPEIEKLDVGMVLSERGALIDSALLRWSWDYEVAA
jgi:hypothetical protein